MQLLSRAPLVTDHITLTELIEGGAPVHAWIACEHPERSPHDPGLHIDSDCAKCRIVMRAIVDRWPDVICREGVLGHPMERRPLVDAQADAMERGRDVSGR